MGEFLVYSLLAFLFAIVGWTSYNAKRPAGLWTFVKAPRVTDLEKYNHAVGRLWYFFAAIFLIFSLASLVGQNGTVAIATLPCAAIAVFGVFMVYFRIEEKYRVK